MNFLAISILSSWIWIFYQKIEECGWRVSERRVKWLSCSHTLFLRPQQQAFLTAFRGEYQKVLHLSLLELLKDEKAFESHKIKLFKPFSFFKQKYGNIWIFTGEIGKISSPFFGVLWLCQSHLYFGMEKIRLDISRTRFFSIHAKLQFWALARCLKITKKVSFLKKLKLAVKQCCQTSH